MPKYEIPPAFLLNPDDFFSDRNVELLNNEEIGAYLRLMGKAWREEKCGSLPDDDDSLRVWAKMTKAKWKRSKPRIMACFKMGRDRRWHQKRLESEFRKYLARKKVRATSASSAANARWRSQIDEHESTLENKVNRCDSHASRITKTCDSHATKRNVTSLNSNTNTRSSTSSSDALCRRLEKPRDDHREIDSETEDQFLRTVRLVRIARSEPQRSKDLELIAKCAILAHRIYGFHWLVDAVEGVRIKQPDKPVAYLLSILKMKAKESGREFTKDLFKTSVPQGFIDIVDDVEYLRGDVG